MEVVALALLVGAVVVAVPLATLLHIEFATERAARHAATFARLARSYSDTDLAAQTNPRHRHLRLVHDKMAGPKR